jgi:deazaflavin-dependent oxidoreductase (nitroreductase family)
MVRQVLRLGLPGSIAVILFALAYRLRPKPVIDAVRVFNKHVTNPPMMALAGRRYWYAAVIRHEGRRSGKEYATPVKAVPVEGGFVVPLSYGEGVDWLKNMLAAGRATIESRGTTYAVAEPEVIGAEAALPLLPPRKRLTWRLFGPRRCLKVKRIARPSSQ